MTLIESIKQTLALADEYSPSAGYKEMYTEDEDFQNKTKILYGQAYQELSQVKKIKKSKTISRNVDKEAKEHYTAYSFPSDLYILEGVCALDSETNKQVEGDFFIRLYEKKIYINDADTSTYKIDYFAYPDVITDETENDFELEIDQDVQMLLAYKVVDDILKTDPSADYSAFRNAYNEAINRLDLRETAIVVKVKKKYEI